MAGRFKIASVLVLVLVVVFLLTRSDAPTAKTPRIDVPHPAAVATGTRAKSGALEQREEAPWLDPLLLPASPEWASSSPEELCRYQEDLVAAIDPAVLAKTFSPSPTPALFATPLWLQLGAIWVPIPSRNYELRLVGDSDRFALGLASDDVTVLLNEGTANVPLQVPGMPEDTLIRDVLLEAYAVDGTIYSCDPEAPGDSARIAVAQGVKPIFAANDDAYDSVTIHADTVDPDMLVWIRQRDDEIRVELSTAAGSLMLEQTGGDDILAIPRSVRDTAPSDGERLDDVSALWAGESGAADRLLHSARLSDTSRRLLEQLQTRPE